MTSGRECSRGNLRGATPLDEKSDDASGQDIAIAEQSVSGAEQSDPDNAGSAVIYEKRGLSLGSRDRYLPDGTGLRHELSQQRGVIRSGAGGTRLCSASNFNLPWPAVPVCGPSPSDTEWTVFRGDTDTWTSRSPVPPGRSATGRRTRSARRTGAHFPEPVCRR